MGGGSSSCGTDPCPSGNYVKCADEGGSCVISDTIKEGYMSYGCNGRYNLIPFTNAQTDGTDLRIECDNDHGDIIPGTTKACCYIATDTGIDKDRYYGSKSEGSGGWIFPQGSTTYGMRYGTGSRFVYRFINGATGWCNNNFFNDPAHGISKTCNYASQAPPSIPTRDSSSWTLCANEGSNCNGLSTSAATWVRYGDNNKYYMRLVISFNDGAIPCNNDFFEDPLVGNGKYCWRAEAQYTFVDVVGQWTKLQSCLGCASNQYKKIVGVTQLTSSELTTTWSTSITATVSAGFDFKVASASTSVSTTISNSVSNRMTNSFSQTAQEETTFTCAKDVLYQWTVGATQNNGISTKSFTVKGEDLACLDNPLEPKCPPGFCSDDSCQSCTTSLSLLPWQFDPNDPSLPQIPSVDEPWFGSRYQLPEEHATWIILLGLITILLCIVNVCLMVYSKCIKRNRGKVNYKPVRVADSEYDSEANILNENK